MLVHQHCWNMFGMPVFQQNFLFVRILCVLRFEMKLAVMVAPNVRGSPVRNLLHVIILRPTIVRLLKSFWGTLCTLLIDM